MTEKSINANSIAETFPIKGETVATWIPSSLALLGTALCILVAQSLLLPHKTEPPAITESIAIDSITSAEKQERVSTGPVTTTPAEPENIKPRKAVNCPPLFYFTFSKDSDAPQNHNLMPRIDRLHHWLQQHPDKKVFIEGHTDASGTEEYNLLLSYRRAKAIERILIEAGIAKQQLITRALGEQDPLMDYPAESEKNRRASIKIDGLETCINFLIDGESD